MEYHFFISFFATLSRAAGFRFLESKGWAFPGKVFIAYCWAADCILGFYVFRIISRLYNPMTFPQALEWISTILYVGQVFLKSIFLRNKNKQIVICVREMNKFFTIVNQRDPKKFAEIWKNQYNFLNHFCMSIFGSQIVCLLLAYAPSFYNTFADPSANFITFPSYYFFYDWHYGVKVGYLVLDFVSSNFCCLKTSAIEMLYLTFVSYHVAALRYLKAELKEIFEELVEGSINEKTLNWWLASHKDALRQILLFKDLVRSLLLIIYIYNLLNIVTMTMFVTANGDMEMSQKMVAVVVVTVTLFYFFWDCLLTDELEALHSTLMLGAFQAKLTLKSQKGLKHMVMFGTMRCRLPLKITAGGVFTPSCWNFKELMTTTASFLVALWEIKNRAMRQNES